MKRLALAFALALTAGGIARAQGVLLEPTPEEKAIGAVDVCVRWGADPAHLSDVIMTNSSGDKDLDAKIPGMILSIPYPRPDGDDGAWFGLNLSFGAATPHHTLPDCDAAVRGLNPPAAPGPAI